MGRGHRYAKARRDEKRDRAGQLGAEAADRADLGDALAHGLDDAPAAEQRPEADCDVAGDHYPYRYRVGAAGVATRDEQHPDDADRLLRVVAAVPQAVERGRKKLQAAKD